MNAPDRAPLAAADVVEGEDLLRPLLEATDAPVDSSRGQTPQTSRPVPIAGPVVGELLAITADGSTPVVRFAGGHAAVPARSTVDLHGAHVGAQVVLLFEEGDAARPIVVGVLREPSRSGVEGVPGGAGVVEVQADGARLIVQAKEQLVLRCGKASITLTKAGRVLIEGGYVLSRSTGVNRIKGGSVQLN